jgi:hypothetical protein
MYGGHYVDMEVVPLMVMRVMTGYSGIRFMTGYDGSMYGGHNVDLDVGTTSYLRLVFVIRVLRVIRVIRIIRIIQVIRVIRLWFSLLCYYRVALSNSR